MSIRTQSPFEITDRAAKQLGLNEEQLSSLREAITERDDSSRFRAVSSLRLAGAEALRELQVVLEDETESARIRRIAAINLGRINIPTSEQILIRSANDRDPDVLAAIMTALGRIGSEQALAVVQQVAKKSTGTIRLRAHFAAVLISHRLGLKGNELPMPRSDQLLKIDPAMTRVLEIRRPDKSETQACFESLSSAPFGIVLSQRAIYQLHCETNQLLLLINEDLAGPDSLKRLLIRKAFFAVAAARNETTGSYSVSFVVLTAPGRRVGTINIWINRATGILVFSGTAKAQQDRADFSISSLAGPGAFPIQIEGTLNADQLVFSSATLGSTVQSRLEPRRKFSVRNSSTS